MTPDCCYDTGEQIILNTDLLDRILKAGSPHISSDRIVSKLVRSPSRDAEYRMPLADAGAAPGRPSHSQWNDDSQSKNHDAIKERMSKYKT